ncbi:fructosamine kinase family protein [Enterococcus sp. AZ109]|uniref:fructosamine kinase family protein n=1 Tax=Enterococcus sp. AZ109 TaxID=2774634 RepID=UPI003F290D9B
MESLLKHLQLENRQLPIGGGDINQAYRVTDGSKDYFLKVHPNMSEAFFQAEVDGLQVLSEVVRVPKTFTSGVYENDAYLLMEWIEPGQGDQRDIGNALAKIHGQKQESFGYRKDNYLGLFPQINTKSNDWWSFYFGNRLEVQIEIAKQRNRWTRQREERYYSLKEQVLLRWENLTFKPSLLHGDFWSGNTFFNTDGEPVFVDPAIYYGHRELDIAMEQLFGGFRQTLFDAYQEIYPLDEGWQERVPVYQLYYLLVHLNLFGESYGGAVDRILGGK